MAFHSLRNMLTLKSVLGTLLKNTIINNTCTVNQETEFSLIDTIYSASLSQKKDAWRLSTCRGLSVY